MSNSEKPGRRITSSLPLLSLIRSRSSSPAEPSGAKSPPSPHPHRLQIRGWSRSRRTLIPCPPCVVHTRGSACSPVACSPGPGDRASGLMGPGVTTHVSRRSGAPVAFRPLLATRAAEPLFHRTNLMSWRAHIIIL
ncbi:hypothetical protein CGRA01v4_10838 [Colletotrichum graminicola]|nr:hypothetical protein CGRA01v4_10838 [Colletotrichum graminicola]